MLADAEPGEEEQQQAVAEQPADAQPGEGQQAAAEQPADAQLGKQGQYVVAQLQLADLRVAVVQRLEKQTLDITLGLGELYFRVTRRYGVLDEGSLAADHAAAASAAAAALAAAARSTAILRQLCAQLHAAPSPEVVAALQYRVRAAWRWVGWAAEQARLAEELAECIVAGAWAVHGLLIDYTYNSPVTWVGAAAAQAAYQQAVQQAAAAARRAAAERFADFGQQHLQINDHPAAMISMLAAVCTSSHNPARSCLSAAATAQAQQLQQQHVQQQQQQPGGLLNGQDRVQQRLLLPRTSMAALQAQLATLLAAGLGPVSDEQLSVLVSGAM